jgi:glycosyltransferase involved in cell wall biosynthesis
MGILKYIISILKKMFEDERATDPTAETDSFQNKDRIISIPPAFRYNIEKLVVAEKGLYGAGWAFDSAGPFLSSGVILQFPDGSRAETDMKPSLTRPDLARAFPDVPHAIHSGFFFLAGWTGNAPAGVRLEFITDSGECHEITSDLPALFESQQIEGADERPFLSGIQWSDLTFQDRKMILVIHHNMGGGSDQYRNFILQKTGATNDNALLLTFVLSEMLFRITWYQSGNEMSVMIFRDIGTLEAWLCAIRLHRIVLNCIVSFPDPKGVLLMIGKLKRQSGASLTLVVHDNFLICPSSFLLDADGNYCGIPGEETCRPCIEKHRDGFVSLTGARDIPAWRRNWESLMNQNTEILCFSDSSRQLILKAYPSALDRVRLQPQEVSAMRTVKFGRKPGNPLVIGVIGHISRHKGADVIRELAEAIEKERIDVRIVVAGTLLLRKIPEQVTVTGPYKHDQLADIIENMHVNIMLMPSVCPETFSFVTHEIILMGLPLITFNFGAQADLARAYPMGLAVSKTDGYRLLQEILLFDKQNQVIEER